MKILILCFCLLNVSISLSQSSKSKKTFKDSTTTSIQVVKDKKDSVVISPKVSTKIDSTQYYDNLFVTSKIRGTETYLLESMNNFIELFNYKKGFYDRYMITGDYNKKLYNPVNDKDYWRFDTDIELAKIFIYFTDDKDSLKALKSIIYNNTIKIRLYEINKVFSEKPDTIKTALILKQLNSFKSVELSEIVNSEIERIRVNLLTYQDNSCKLRTDLLKLNNIVDRKNIHLLKDLKDAESRYSYSPYLTSLILGIKKQKVDEVYFVENFGVCLVD